MAIYKKDFVDIELSNNNISRNFTNRKISEGDSLANWFGVRIFRDGSPISVADCTVVGYFIRPDGVTLTLQGSAENNEAGVGLPANCYTVTGQYTLAIKLIGGGVTGTMRIIDGTIIDITTDSVVDPGGTVPDIEELMTVIERAEDAAEDIRSFNVHTELISGDDYSLIVNTQGGV